MQNALRILWVYGPETDMHKLVEKIQLYRVAVFIPVFLAAKLYGHTLKTGFDVSTRHAVYVSARNKLNLNAPRLKAKLR